MLLDRGLLVGGGVGAGGPGEHLLMPVIPETLLLFLIPCPFSSQIPQAGGWSEGLAQRGPRGVPEWGPAELGTLSLAGTFLAGRQSRSPPGGRICCLSYLGSLPQTSQCVQDHSLLSLTAAVVTRVALVLLYCYIYQLHTENTKV